MLIIIISLFIYFTNQCLFKLDNRKQQKEWHVLRFLCWNPYLVKYIFLSVLRETIRAMLYFSELIIIDKTFTMMKIFQSSRNSKWRSILIRWIYTQIKKDFVQEIAMIHCILHALLPSIAHANINLNTACTLHTLTLYTCNISFIRTFLINSNKNSCV